MTEPQVSVVIGSYNRHAFLRLTIQSVREELHDLASEIIVVDGGSDDGTLQWLAAQRDVIAIIQHNRGVWSGKKIERRSWGYFMNLGFKAAQGKYICMLSDDCLAVPGAIRNGIAHAEAALSAGRKIGAVAFYWRNWPEQPRYWVGLTFGGKMFVNHGLYTKSALEAVGYADEENFSFYHADGDLCLKMWRQGFECIDAPDSFVEHYSHANREARETNLATQKQDWQRYMEKWRMTSAVAQRTDGSGWLYRDFSDASKTAEKFRTVLRVKVDLAYSAVRQRFGRIRQAAARMRPRRGDRGT